VRVEAGLLGISVEFRLGQTNSKPRGWLRLSGGIGDGPQKLKGRETKVPYEVGKLKNISWNSPYNSYNPNLDGV
jgi:hypothetical protein